nr:MAG TPA: CHAP domain protein [Bacteriophage sp.]
MPKSPFFTNREKIKGTKNLMQGDIIICSHGQYGHVAIVDHVLNGKVYVLEQNGSGKNSGSGLGANAIRIQPYNLSFYDTVLRCKKIFDNLVLEREFVAKKIARLEKE